MLIEIKEITTVTLVLFAIIDILGSVPIILDIKSKVGHVDAKYATLVSGFIMIVFLFLGNELLNLIGIDVASFSIAGSIVIFLIGLEMTLNRDIFKSGNTSVKSSSVVPIAFPMIAGAGTLTTLLSLRSEYHVSIILIAVFINLTFIFIVIRFIPKIEKLLGDTGINIFRKVFGVILLSIAIKLFSKNVALLF
ncbi:MAG TPA: MarC family protein [Chitinophagales bacterium]|jgi:multiple antibiotic resistance protein|nr:MarC family protein [Chitinophagales bacterium]MBP6153255.1 MarC family protein [Chitinophagales bacterium]HQV78843.1 MarC family protein [Chitinophagales bacterium]HQW79209.1 MarC family protein [Chitinophagales bacterium]HRB20014.1 MarC family protein [Chitinophagales bacterium]